MVLSLSVILLILSIVSTYFLIWRKRKSFYLLKIGFNIFLAIGIRSRVKDFIIHSQLTTRIHDYIILWSPRPKYLTNFAYANIVKVLGSFKSVLRCPHSRPQVPETPFERFKWLQPAFCCGSWPLMEKQLVLEIQSVALTCPTISISMSLPFIMVV